MALDPSVVYRSAVLPRLMVASLFLAAQGSLAADAPAAPAGEEELSLDDLDKLDAPSPGEKPHKATTFKVPLEHDYDRRLLVLPALLVMILAWNVDWKKPAPRRKT